MDQVRRAEAAVQALKVIIAHREDGGRYLSELKRLIDVAASRKNDEALLAEIRAEVGLGRAANSRRAPSARKAA